MLRLLPIVLALLIFSCSSDSTPVYEQSGTKFSTVDTSFASKVSAAHNAELFKSFEIVRFHIQLYFGGTERLNADVTLATNGSMGFFALADSTFLAFDGTDVFTSVDYQNPEKARFAAFTWSYFFLFPYKLQDPGTRWVDYTNSELNGKRYKVEKLEFAPGTGDAPDDWYVVYADPESNLLHAAAYIVTAGSNRVEAEADPHAITYSKYERTNAIPLAKRWDFYAWRAGDGLTDELGYAEISGISFSKENFEFPLGLKKSIYPN